MSAVWSVPWTAACARPGSGVCARACMRGIVCQIIWGICMPGECRLVRTLYDLSEDAKLEPVGEVNKWMDQSRQKTIQHLQLHLLFRVVSIS